MRLKVRLCNFEQREGVGMLEMFQLEIAAQTLDRNKFLKFYTVHFVVSK